MPKVKIPTFEERSDQIIHEIEKRRAAWTLASMAFEDARQTVLIRIYQKYHTYDPKKDPRQRPEEVVFLHWVNRLISNEIKNILRNNLRKWSRPCVASLENPKGCPFNAGDNLCDKTPSGLQCAECKAYRDWEKRKLQHFNVKQTLPLENHIREADSHPASNHIDFDEKKKVLDERILKRLNRQEQVIYTAIFIKGQKEEDVGKALKFKKVGRTYAGYSPILRLKHKAEEIARDILENEGLF